jgi:hypothetical protein
MIFFICLCVDFWDLNNTNARSKYIYLVPVIEEVVGSSWFSYLNLTIAYHLTSKTTFQTSIGTSRVPPERDGIWPHGRTTALLSRKSMNCCANVFLCFL